MPLLRHVMLTIVLGAVWAGTVRLTTGAQPPTLPALLGAAASYVAAYEEQAAAIVFEETYSQWITGPQTGLFSSRERRLRSDVAVIYADGFGWIGFRDVFDVDGRPVRDRQDRFQRLFGQSITPAAIAQARAIADESARFNVGHVGRNLNYPTMALVFLRQNHQDRSTFWREGSARVDGSTTWMVDFQETRRPTLIASSERDLLTYGRFWVEPDNGRIRRSRITVDVVSATCTYEVEYGAWPGLDVLMPIEMEEVIAIRGKDPRTSGDPRPVQIIRGQARYSNVRQFKGRARIEGVVIQP
jgi:hypothetical protein